MATIRKHRDKWQVRIRRAGLRPMSKSFAVRKDAMEWGRQMEVRADRAELPADPKALERITLGDLVRRYIDTVSSRKKSAAIPSTPADFTPWHALHDYICSGSALVVIPFAEDLVRRLPVSHFRVLRDFPQVLKLISAHALLHQVNRATENGEIVATLDDYEAVYDLVSDALSEGLETSVTKTVREVVEAVEAEINNQVGGISQGISQPGIAERLGRDQSVISRTVHRAIDDGYLANLTSGQGRQSTLILGERKLPGGSVLPSPQQLRDVTTETRRTDEPF
jgi:hypothetical protein